VIAVAEDQDEPEVCSTLRWKDVSLPQSVTEADLDTLIFSALAQTWRKTARIVGSTFEQCEARSFPVSLEVIAARIQALAEAGKIEGKGNLSMWRHSEVRLRSG
jgi:hypothetical protein